MLKSDENGTGKDRSNDNTEDNAGGGNQSTDYKVGRGRPPLQTRFKPGKSGNPKGRPVGSVNVGTLVKRVINKKVAVREGKKTRKMTLFEAAYHAHAVKATQGDARSATVFFGTAQKMGLLTDQPNNDEAHASSEAAIF